MEENEVKVFIPLALPCQLAVSLDQTSSGILSLSRSHELLPPLAPSGLAEYWLPTVAHPVTLTLCFWFPYTCLFQMVRL